MLAIVKFIFANGLRRIRRLRSLLNSVHGEHFSSHWDVTCRLVRWFNGQPPYPRHRCSPEYLWNSVPWVLEMASVHSLKPNNHYSPRLCLNLRDQDWARKIKWNMSLLNDLLRSLMVQGWRSLLFTNECDRTLLLFLCLRPHTKACQPPIHSHDMVLHVLPHSDTEYVPKKKDC